MNVLIRFQGDLKSYLRKHRSEAQEMAHQDIQLKMANDMINGLMWLHQADFIYVLVFSLLVKFSFVYLEPRGTSVEVLCQAGEAFE